MDAALETLIAAHQQREQVAERRVGLWNLVAHPRQGLTRSSGVEQAVRAAEAALMRGPEPPPVLPESFVPPEAEPIPDLEASSW